MFTGIIEEIGVLKSIEQRGKVMQLKVQASQILDDLKTDDSVAIDGICLTATSVGSDYFTLDASQETLSRTTLAHVKRDQQVNLERALRLSDRVGGHIVQGHVDGMGSLLRFSNDPQGGDWVFRLPHEHTKYVIPKGSIAINGVSLTVAEKNGDQIRTAIIPHTLRATTFQYMREGDSVNIEIDFFAKYIEQFLNKSNLSMDWLKEQGFE